MSESAPKTTAGDDVVITVRRAETDDLDALVAADPRPELGLPARRLAEQEAGSGVFAVAEIDGEVVGSGFLDFNDEELNPELKNLWVPPAQRRHGVGTALWRWLEERAAEAGHRQVFLAVDPQNFRAIPLFLELGYSPTGDHLFMETPDSYQVLEPDQPSNYHAIYRKSLLAG